MRIIKVFAAFSIIYLTRQLSASGNWAEAKVMSCHDGDTCRVELSKALTIKIRLAGIDTPEMGDRQRKPQPFAIEARDFLSSQIVGKQVQLRQIALDRYNRPVVEVKVANKIINLALLKKGLAEVYKKSGTDLDKVSYLKAEAAAKKLKIGIWNLKNYQTPYQFRKSKKSRGVY